MGVLVEPRIGSYVTEWEAVQFDGANVGAVRGILRNSPWVMHLNLTDSGAFIMVTQVNNGQLQQWTVSPMDWVVRSPHGKYWFMSTSEFESQFHVWADKV